ncbi:MAG: hypothetical protein QOD40_770 [Alphaproteobacteria bacterium]|jgi:hypothetical protein|nr:hypothetical protein [Alphaproteobacteria bacterium]
MKTHLHIVRNASAALLLAATVSGCGSFDMLFVTPGAFDYSSCADIAAAVKGTSARQQELKVLIDKAEQESAGVIIAAGAYRSEYLKTQGDLKLLQETARTKNCETQAKP